ncbi:MAG: hypothetical protein C6W57_12150 [Caldibacillus debilis]|uniref:fumarylacetoacetate hydrolase family protein n=1 Tax=Caldibacillus debilis TaxID=301148 RepID=UPI000E37B5D8|nr:fumarylacetoacetate hydrolase family protein [Caldibacillus debilis]REJ15074.1 MAG: hypothetical protein C6W57_12150 [Caldibacillus debilis]
MKFLTATAAGKGTFLGLALENGREIVPLSDLERFLDPAAAFPKTMLELIEKEDQFFPKIAEACSRAEQEGALKNFAVRTDEVRFLPPHVPRKNIFCVGKNYREHALEMGGEESVPEALIVFTKAPTALIGHRETVPAHGDLTGCLDYEGELAVVIGKRGRKIRKEAAASHIFGYTIVNDVTARDLQKKHRQFFLGKSLDGSCPIGPWIVHRSAVEDPCRLRIETRVNGELRQKARAGEMIFSIDEIIAEISRGITLEPGDIIATGTPSGVGSGFRPPKFLRPGDWIEVSIDGIGVLQNRVGE